ncbi:MAG: hypothetical protein JW811_07825 [Clostridiales bacterium]|nr:hypothetical protein [Clostridiales bacterium]
MSKEHKTTFESYRLSLSAAEDEALTHFFTEYDHHNFLKASDKALMRRDFENAILKYISLGVPLETALKRLGIEHLGGFYARPSLRWFALDSAAKIYPFSMAHGRMAVFRLSVYLTEEVVPEILQMALTFTIKRFPSFATTVKKGFFWHYLDTAKRRYSLEKEASIPCRPLIIARSGSQSFRVIYYQNRVSVEFFHVLTDGFGGTVFLKTLIAEYLRLLGIEISQDSGTFDIDGVPSPREISNEFSLVPKTKNASGFVDKPAVQMSGRLSRYKPCRVLHFNMDADALKLAAKKHSATITSYLLALIFVAVKSATDETKGSINIQVPVNMRKFYPSDTLRNFSMYCGIRLPLREIADVQSIIKDISDQLTQKASRDAMSEMVTATRRIVSALRHIPLIIKTPVIKLVNGLLSDRIFSSTLSNLGVVSLPSGLINHVVHMDAVMSPAVMNRTSCAIVTCGNTTTLSITKATADPSFEEKLYALLFADAVSPSVEGSALYED